MLKKLSALKNVVERKKEGKSKSIYGPMMALMGFVTLLLAVFVQPPWLCELLKTLSLQSETVTEYLCVKGYEGMEKMLGEEAARPIAEYASVLMRSLVELITLVLNEGIQRATEMLKYMEIPVSPRPLFTLEEVERTTKGPLLALFLFLWTKTVLGRLVIAIAKRLLALVRIFLKVMKIVSRII